MHISRRGCTPKKIEFFAELFDVYITVRELQTSLFRGMIMSVFAMVNYLAKRCAGVAQRRRF